MYRYEGRPRFPPFWAVTRYDDVRYVLEPPRAVHPTAGVIRLDTDNGPRPAWTRYKAQAGRALRLGPRRAPRHALHRPARAPRPAHASTVRRFTPGRDARLADDLDDLARRFVDEFVAARPRGRPRAGRRGGEPLGRGADRHHLRAARRPRPGTGPTIRRWSDQTLLTPDLDHPDVRPGETAADVRRRAGQEYHAYRQRAHRRGRRRAGPRRRARHRHAPGPRHHRRPTARRPALHGYIELLVGGGNETTRNTITGGVQALLEHPDQARRARRRPRRHGRDRGRGDPPLGLTGHPVRPHRHRATSSSHGQHDPRGRHRRPVVPLSQPRRAPVRRPLPLRHRAATPTATSPSATAQHFCLGANLARWELRAVFRDLAPHLAHLELAGGPKRLPGLHVGAIQLTSPSAGSTELNSSTANRSKGNCCVVDGVAGGGRVPPFLAQDYAAASSSMAAGTRSRTKARVDADVVMATPQVLHKGGARITTHAVWPRRGRASVGAGPSGGRDRTRSD